MTQALFTYCPQSLYGTGCTDPACTLVHDAKYCQLCAAICEPASSFNNHLNSTQHTKSLERPYWVHCPVCNISETNKPDVWDIHAAGRPHKQAATQRGVQPDSVRPTSPPTDSPLLKRCDLCNITLHIIAWDSHIAGRRHKLQEQHMAYRSAFVRASQDRDGINVSHAEDGLDFGIVDSAAAKKGVQSELLVSTENGAPVTLVSTDVISGSGVGIKHRKRTP